MLLNENLFKEIPKRKLKEKHWEHKIDKDLAFRLRDILEDDDTDYEALREVMKAIYDNIHRLIPDMFDEYECENAKEELDILDTEDSGYYGDDDEDEDPIDVEDSWNYELSNLYDICDTFNIWIPIRTLDECEDTEVQESYDKDGNHETCEECGALLTDAGECPRCVHGEEDLKEAFATKDMPGLIKAAKAAGLTTLSELDAFIKEHEGEDIMKALADKKKTMTESQDNSDKDIYIKTLAQDTYESGQPYSSDDFNLFYRIGKEDGLELTQDDFAKYFEYLDDVGSHMNESNTITNELPESIDQFLMDIAQTTNAFDYNDISKFAKRATEEDIKKLKNLRRKWLRDAEMMEDDEVKEFGNKVKEIVKKNLKERMDLGNENNTDIDDRDPRNSSYPKFNPEDISSQLSADGKIISTNGVIYGKALDGSVIRAIPVGSGLSRYVVESATATGSHYDISMDNFPDRRSAVAYIRSFLWEHK